jgi:hypothetical protein
MKETDKSQWPIVYYHVIGYEAGLPVCAPIHLSEIEPDA